MGSRTSPVQSLPAALTRWTSDIERALRDVALPTGELLGRMAAYHMGWVEADGSEAGATAGKRIRPSLVCWAAEACGGSLSEALPAACAVELTHNFTLVHDDVQDRDRLRRGRETVWAVWGEAQAINAGDAINAIALSTLLPPATAPLEVQARGGQAVAALLRVELEVIEGQTLDLEHECRPDTPPSIYLRMIEAKTGALLGGSLQLGGIVAGATPTVTEQLRLAGRLLGVAFQLRDDWLGVWGEPALTGKSRENDLARRKLTYPVVRAFERAEAAQRRELVALYESRGPAQEPRIRQLLEALGGPELTARSAAEAAAHAVQAIDGCGLDSTAVEELADVARYFAERNR
ncbi:MAG: polyprenyl synthetase family protein [Candidatus Dormiibacterota bacterium]